MGYTKKQRREQKKRQFDRKIPVKKAPERSTTENEAILHVVVKAIWTTPDGEQRPDYELITVPRSTSLDFLQQQIQGEKEEHLEGDRFGWKVSVEVSHQKALLLGNTQP